MLKAQINNKGIQWGLSNPNPLGTEVFQPRELFSGRSALKAEVFHIQNMKQVCARIPEHFAESNLQLEDQQGNFKQLRIIFRTHFHIVV